MHAFDFFDRLSRHITKRQYALGYAVLLAVSLAAAIPFLIVDFPSVAEGKILGAIITLDLGLGMIGMDWAANDYIEGSESEAAEAWHQYGFRVSVGLLLVAVVLLVVGLVEQRV